MEENSETYSKKTKRFYMFILVWNWIWLAFSLWNWKRSVKRAMVSREAMWMYERGTGRPRMLTLVECFPLLTKRCHRSLCHTEDCRLTICLQKKQKKFKRNLLHLFSVYLSADFKTKKKWNCTFSNQNWFLLPGRIRLILKVFLYSKMLLRFHDLIIENI